MCTTQHALLAECVKGFKLVKSKRQEITHPAIKKKHKALGRLYKKHVKTKPGNTAGKQAQYAKLQEKTNVLEQKVRRSVEDKKMLPAKIDVSTLEDYRNFSRIDDEGKYLFDFVTTSVWNARKEMLNWLGEYYDEDNELLDLFYAITSWHGWVKNEKDTVRVRLDRSQSRS